MPPRFPCAQPRPGASNAPAERVPAVVSPVLSTSRRVNRRAGFRSQVPIKVLLGRPRNGPASKRLALDSTEIAQVIGRAAILTAAATDRQGRSSLWLQSPLPWAHPIQTGIPGSMATGTCSGVWAHHTPRSTWTGTPPPSESGSAPRGRWAEDGEVILAELVGGIRPAELHGHAFAEIGRLDVNRVGDEERAFGQLERDDGV